MMSSYVGDKSGDEKAVVLVDMHKLPPSDWDVSDAEGNANRGYDADDGEINESSLVNSPQLRTDDIDEFGPSTQVN